ncbi:thioesterase-like superfamily-domain-containing protein [Aspergillus pseudotamarii]|uniref:Thioesterase-like superfamily-domain-containing protein n=1 Tax=Aspergillus pseudotamarii TaxID=132259 RepID=A0A5N6T5Z3_ASPPS|nr:thioesterase-like superfamily-domain-containing protein [Aspergillus pseudotamarii]KAE8141710.1 thioesterase-like superfamily-domain-containing protein [Aspergillus pseudotamarii]
MADTLPTSLSTALDISPSGDHLSLELPTDIAFGAVSCGGYVASLMAKYAVVHASKHEKLRTQTDIRTALAQFYRPIIASKPVQMQLREVSLGKAWSTLRIETFQFGKIAASADIWLSDFQLPGINLQTGWHLTTRPVDLSKLEMDCDPEWTSYQTAFHRNGFRRGHSYVRNFIPKSWPSDIKFTEQWILPGWDCFPRGSCAMQKDEEKARWTTEMIQFAIDMSLPVQENFFPRTKRLPTGSVAATLEFAEAQRQARIQGKPNWRELELDGSTEPNTETVNVALSMSTEVKKNLPPGGVRWLYLRSEVKRIIDGRMDMEILLCDETMELIAISQHAAQIIPSAQKWEKGGKDAKI